MVIVGVGNLGHALANYGGFASRGFRVVGLVDADPRARRREDPGRHRRRDDRGALHRRPRGRRPRRRREHRRHRHPGARRAGRVRPARRRRRHEHPQLRARRAQHRRRASTCARSTSPPSCRSSPSTSSASTCASGGARVTLLVVGVSHRTAPVSLLDRLALVDGAAEAAAGRAARLPARRRVAGALHLQPDRALRRGRRSSTARVVDVTETLAKATGVDREELTPHLYVRYDERAVQHLFEVAAGLDSMVVGEQQILGQVRSSLRSAQESATAGRSLNDLAQAALRVGKRVHADTGIDRAGISVVSVALDARRRAARRRRSSAAPRVVVGAGAMSSLAATLLRARRRRRPRRRQPHVRARPAPRRAGRWARRRARRRSPESCAAAEILVSCTGSTGLGAHGRRRRRRALGCCRARAARRRRPRPAARRRRGRRVARRASRASASTALAELPAAQASEHDVELARTIVAEEVRAHLAAHRGAARRADRRVAARPRRRRRRRRAPAAAPAPARARRHGGRRVRALAAPRGADAAAHADRADEGARRRPRRRALRHRAAPPLRPRPVGHRRDRGRRRPSPRAATTRPTTSCSGGCRDRRPGRHPRPACSRVRSPRASPPRCGCGSTARSRSSR